MSETGPASNQTKNGAVDSSATLLPTRSDGLPTGRSGSFVTYAADLSSSIRSSSSDHGQSPSRKRMPQAASDQGGSEAVAANSGAVVADDSAASASPSSQIRRRYYSMNDVRQAALGANGIPVSNSLGSVAAAAAREAAPPVDPNALPDILSRTQILADSLASSVEKIAAQLRTMAKLTVENLNVVDETAASTCESAEMLVKTLYSLMSKYDEMRKELYIIPTVSQQLKEIERLLDVLELHVSQADRIRP